MRDSRRVGGVLALATVWFGAMATGARAQEKTWSFEGRGGVAIPVSDLEDLEDVGANIGVGASYALSDRFSLYVDGSVDILSGADSGVSGSSAPDMNIFHYGAGVSLALVEPESSAWSFDVGLGGGGSTFDSDTFTANGVSSDFSETYFTLDGNLEVGYDLSPSVSVFVDGRAYLMFTDEQDTRVFSQVSSEVDPGGFDTAWTIPLTAGVKIRV